MSPVSKAAYRDYLGKLELQYGRLQVSGLTWRTRPLCPISSHHQHQSTSVFPPQKASKARLHYLDQLHAFVTAATKELMWLNDKEEEEVNYDWSEKNTNMTSKKDNYSVGRLFLPTVLCGGNDD